MKSLVVIPTRLDSRRFPRKPLALIDGKEMILHVAEQASKAMVDSVIVATPDREIYDLVTEHGFDCFITSHDCLTGTDRLCEVAEFYPDYNVYVNVQGDEPMIDPADITSIVILKDLYYNCVINGVAEYFEKPNNKNVVKVFVKDHEVLTMTRKLNGNVKQCGLYAFNRADLIAYSRIKNKKEKLADCEDIEIMLFKNYLGKAIKTLSINSTISVDVAGDIEKIMEEIKNGRRN
jgi:3-deoxy-manno-octulosonate cytidylyltransferase (CMP-KDO synthetase)